MLDSDGFYEPCNIIFPLYIRSEAKMEGKNTFKYTYSAKEQDEIKRIRQKYQSQEEDSMIRLRKLDASATSKATVIALILGIGGALIFGMGMRLIMTDLAALLEMTGMKNMIVGIIAEKQKLIKSLTREIGNLAYETIKAAKEEISVLKSEKKKSTIICQECGSKTSVDMKYCGKCGTCLQET